MLLGYVSDERYLALAGAEIEILGPRGSTATRSRASGAVHADVDPGRYELILAKDGYGSKRATVDVAADRPHHFRLLKDDLLGYAWPKWVRSGEASEFRVHSDAAYRLDLWRYGWQKELGRPLGWVRGEWPRGAGANNTPRGHKQNGVVWEKIGHTNPHPQQ